MIYCGRFRAKFTVGADGRGAVPDLLEVERVVLLTEAAGDAKRRMRREREGEEAEKAQARIEEAENFARAQRFGSLDPRVAGHIEKLEREIEELKNRK